MATIKSTFYDTLPGQGVKETTWAQSAMSRGPLFGVVTPDDFTLTAHPTTAYALNVGGGRAWGNGVWDEVEGSTTLTATPPANAATRWDLVCIRRDWQPTGGGPSALRIVEGSSSQQLPAAMEKRPGIISDQPLYLVQWKGGTTTPLQIIDLRCFAGPGGIEIVHPMAREYLAYPGATVKMAGQEYWYTAGANNVWDWTSGDTGWVSLTPAAHLGIVGERTSGNWVKITNCEARIVANGSMVHVRGELAYVNPGATWYTPTEGVTAAILPPGMRPTTQCYIPGTTAQYSRAAIYPVLPDGSIQLGPNPDGKIAQFNGVFPLR